MFSAFKKKSINLGYSDLILAKFRSLDHHANINWCELSEGKRARYGKRTEVKVQEFVCPRGSTGPNWVEFGLKPTILRLAPKVEYGF